ncbi:glycosyltransferase [Herbiconiux sp. VKM Ac-1786]|uniref:glycosyltransferase n=1 Tax=Herbiconiux sp. VKM Ac-1786 TaxID=2783824 RepID=UPI00188CEAEC|nr:glycosyltransferase [Herbiconiux sp. VKM Ac-1786]MBF4574422.1 glycosyltransferase [Herbiconiux sp. VKM Ac-1786]
MHARVTAVLVSSNGADYLPRTLEAIAAQTRAPDALVVVDCASTDATSALLAAAQPTRFIQASSRLNFGTAISHALGVAPPPADENEWLWLLAHDTAPEPDALAALLAAVEVNPSVAAAGPKQMEWDDPDYISEFGETVTRLGASVPLVETELDQAQHDRMSDVLAMGAAGLLVRHTVWNEVGGFDPALPTADNSLDFSIRTRLAGHRVIAVPAARVSTDGDGLSGPGRSIKGSARRKRQTARRAAQLHRRLVYAPPFAVVFHWLSLVPLAVGRSLFQLVRKQPGAIGGEFAAAFKTAFGSHIGAARRQLKASKKVGWRAIAPLRMPGDEMRRRASLQREIALTYLRGERDRIQFISSGGVATVLVVALIGFVVFLPVFGAAAITGDGALPLETTVGGLWAQIGTGFRDIGLGFVGAADPFAAVLAVLGSLTFWSPSFAIVGLYLVALPLAALAAWFCAARLTDRPVLRSAAAVLWVLAPPFVGALDAGMIGPVLAHLLLPWLVLALLAAPKSWSASAIASILFAAVLATAPSLWPALIVVWLIATIASRRDVMRLIGIPVPALALFAPLIWDQFQRGTPLALLADPGLPVWRPTVPVIELLLGLPRTGLGGWESLAAGVGIDAGVVLLVLGILVVPLALIALAALFLPGSYRAVVAVVIALLGFATAVASQQLALATSGSQSVVIWPGSGLSLAWLGLVGAAVIGLSSLPRLVALPAVVATAAVAVIVLPSALGLLLGTSEVAAGSARQLPAYVTAEASNTPRVGTLLLSPQGDGGIGASVVHGAGPTLDQQSTLASTAALSDSVGADGSELASIVGNAASISGAEVSSRLTALGIEFVLLTPAPADEQGAPADDIASRTANALNSNAQFTFIGDTFAGALWQVADDGTLASLPQPSPTNTGTPLGVLVLVIQAFVFGIALLLALPAGRLQVQGNRAVSTTAHVGAADSVEEEIAEEKLTDVADRVPVGEEPEVLDTPAGPSPAPAVRPATPSAPSAEPSAAPAAPSSLESAGPAAAPGIGTGGPEVATVSAAALAGAAAAAVVADRTADSVEPAADADADRTADTVEPLVAGADDDERAQPEVVGASPTGERAASSVTTPAGVYAAHYVDEQPAAPDAPASVPAPAPVPAPESDADTPWWAGTARPTMPVAEQNSTAEYAGHRPEAPTADETEGSGEYTHDAPVEAPVVPQPSVSEQVEAATADTAPTPVIPPADSTPDDRDGDGRGNDGREGEGSATEALPAPVSASDHAATRPTGPVDALPSEEARPMSRFEPGYEAPAADPLPGPDYSDYDPDDETVLTVRDAADRDAADDTAHENHEEGTTDGR